jgi:glycine/D-amino acid oxidase-like deaminating enzyme
LRTAKENLWLDMPYEPGAPISGDHEADVAVIGGGFTGLAAAYFIRKRFPEKRVIVLEGEFVGYGASGRNTGISGATLGHSLARLRKTHGTEGVSRLQNLSLEAFSLVEELIEQHNIECDYERTGLLVVAQSAREVKILEEEARACSAVGEEATLLDGTQASSRFGAAKPLAGLYHALQATLNPAKLARGMKKAAESAGAEIYEHSTCTHVETGQMATLYTSLGTVRARDTIVATNAYPNPLGLLRRKVVPFHVYNIVTEPLTQKQLDEFHWPERTIVFNPKHLFWVLRLTADNRIVFIDNDAKYFYDINRDYSHNPGEYQNHYKVLLKLFPFLEGIRMTHAWGGRIGITLDFLPRMGCIGEYSNIFYSLGYNGHGVAFTQLAGKMLAELIAREKTELTDHILTEKPLWGIPTAPLSYLAINGYKYVYKVDDMWPPFQR